MKNCLFILTLLFAGISLNGYAQDSKKEKQEVASQSVKAAVEGRKFTFKAKSATPSKGGVIQLTSGYAMSVTPEQINSELPYYGRAFSGGYGGSETGITFTSKAFEYDVKPKKKGGWDVTIKPTDVSQIVKLFLSITSDGYATLRVTSTDRDSISYSGVIE
ncbi:MAG: DUF4251 domain-containing protein [Algoriphagus sp.]|nr:DUF4251 domain-containing protein [Algoriphagus sp.]